MKNSIRKIECELFSIYNSEGEKKTNKLHNAIIIGKSLFTSKTQGAVMINDNLFLNEYSFEYSYNIPFDKNIPINGKKEKKVNTKITYEFSENELQVCYTHFTCFQKFINSWNFRRSWIQQPSNIMWIINILVAILAVLAALSHCFKHD